MKFTSKILLALLLITLAAMVSSNIILKSAYDKVDKSDLYWTYENVLQQPFKHIKITGGNVSKIAWEPAGKCSVRILQSWRKYFGGHVNAQVNNDTLYLNYDFVPADQFQKNRFQNTITVRVFSPELLSVEGDNTNFEMYKVKQKSITANMRGKSKFELESMLQDFDSLNLSLKDSSVIVFEMSPDFKKAISKEIAQSVNNQTQNSSAANAMPAPGSDTLIEDMSANSVKANVEDHSLLDIGHAQIKSLQLHVTDSAAVLLSGGAIKNKIQQ